MEYLNDRKQSSFHFIGLISNAEYLSSELKVVSQAAPTVRDLLHPHGFD